MAKQLNKTAVILTADKFEDMEVFFPLFRLLEMGWQVDIAAPTKKKIGGEHGYSLDPTITIDQVAQTTTIYSLSRAASLTELRRLCAK